MPTSKEWIAFFYPFLFDAEDKRYINDADLTMALAVAEDYRPACLSEDRQNQAMAHYASYIIEFRRRAKEIGAAVSDVAVVAGPIIEEAEGDTSVKYAQTSSSGSIITIKEQLTGPGTPYAAFIALWEICNPSVPDGKAPVRRGAIITAFG